MDKPLYLWRGGWRVGLIKPYLRGNHWVSRYQGEFIPTPTAWLSSACRVSINSMHYITVKPCNYPVHYCVKTARRSNRTAIISLFFGPSILVLIFGQGLPVFFLKRTRMTCHCFSSLFPSFQRIGPPPKKETAIRFQSPLAGNDYDWGSSTKRTRRLWIIEFQCPSLKMARGEWFQLSWLFQISPWRSLFFLFWNPTDLLVFFWIKDKRS